MKRRVFLAVLGLALLCVVWLGISTRPSHAPTQAAPATVRIAYKANAAYQHFFVAMEKGCFEKLGIKVVPVEFESTNEMLESLVAGRVEVTSGSSTEVIGMVQQNSPGVVKVFLASVWRKDNPFDFLLVAKDSAITTIEQLKGKKVATIPGSTPVNWLQLIFAKYFDPKKDIDIIETSPRLQLQALAAKQVDAVYTVEPVVTIGEVKGISRVLKAGPIHDVLMDELPAGLAAMSTRFIKENPTAAQGVISALEQAVDFIRANPGETKTITAKYTKLDLQVASRLKVFEYWKRGEIKVEVVQQYLDFLAEHQILAKRVSARDMLLGPAILPSK